MKKAIKSVVSRLLHPFSLAFSYSPLITISISRSALLHNFNQFRKLNAGKALIPVLKSNAYGHGIALVAEILEKNNKESSRDLIAFFAVDSYFEAKKLRSESIATPLLIIGYSTSEIILGNRLKNVVFTITGLAGLIELDEMMRGRASRSCTIHLKLDTGMHRQGILEKDADQAISIIRNNPSIVLEGISSHFAESDAADPTFTRQQIKLWNNLVKKFKSATAIGATPTLKYWHISNTAGHTYEKEIDANVSRLGIGLYGLEQGLPIEKELHLQPALEMTTLISDIKTIPKGESVGYSRTFNASRETRVAIIPVGYFEGVDRRLSNKGMFKIKDSFAPIIGRVSMNITTIDISNIPEATHQEPVVVISRTQNDPNSVVAIAHLCETIPYEIVVHISEHLKRVVV